MNFKHRIKINVIFTAQQNFILHFLRLEAVMIYNLEFCLALES